MKKSVLGFAMSSNLQAKKYCIVCGKSFRPKSKAEKSCSDECKLKRKRFVTEEHKKKRQRDKRCYQCGSFFRVPLKSTKNYCSDQCRRNNFRGDAKAPLLDPLAPVIEKASTIQNSSFQKEIDEFASRGGVVKKFPLRETPKILEEFKELLEDE